MNYKIGDKVLITQCCKNPCQCPFGKIGILKGIRSSENGDYPFLVSIKKYKEDISFYKIEPLNKLAEALYYEI